MVKLDYDDEQHILEDFHDLNSKECLILSDDVGTSYYEATAKIIDSLLKANYLKFWQNNVKSHNPPDFINKKEKAILEIMRFDDHSSDGKHNPVLSKERKMAKELKAFADKYPYARLNIIAKTDLPTDIDHNYKNLYTSFQRTVNKHLSKLSFYKSNFPNTKTVFLVFNESSGNYFESIEGTLGKIYFIFYDNRILNTFINSDLDYLIIYSPYNHFKTIQKHKELPKAVIFDVRRLKKSKMMQFIDYDEKRMKSSEL